MLRCFHRSGKSRSPSPRRAEVSSEVLKDCSGVLSFHLKNIWNILQTDWFLWKLKLLKSNAAAQHSAIMTSDWCHNGNVDHKPENSDHLISHYYLLIQYLQSKLNQNASLNNKRLRQRLTLQQWGRERGRVSVRKQNTRGKKRKWRKGKFVAMCKTQKSMKDKTWHKWFNAIINYFWQLKLLFLFFIYEFPHLLFF